MEQATYIHHVPGRLRVRLAGAKNNPTKTQSLRTLLRSTPGVLSVTASAVTGSVLVHYDSRYTSAPALLQQLRARDARQPVSTTAILRPSVIRASAAANHQPFTTRIRRRVAKAAIDFIVDKAVEKATYALIAAIL